jgi:hypothetical protein
MGPPHGAWLAVRPFHRPFRDHAFCLHCLAAAVAGRDNHYRYRGNWRRRLDDEAVRNGAKLFRYQEWYSGNEVDALCDELMWRDQVHAPHYKPLPPWTGPLQSGIVSMGGKSRCALSCVVRLPDCHRFMAAHAAEAAGPLTLSASIIRWPATTVFGLSGGILAWQGRIVRGVELRRDFFLINFISRCVAKCESLCEFLSSWFRNPSGTNKLFELEQIDRAQRHASLPYPANRFLDHNQSLSCPAIRSWIQDCGGTFVSYSC